MRRKLGNSITGKGRKQGEKIKKLENSIREKRRRKQGEKLRTRKQHKNGRERGGEN
jgi:hypothetical protein